VHTCCSCPPRQVGAAFGSLLTVHMHLIAPQLDSSGVLHASVYALLGQAVCTVSLVFMPDPLVRFSFVARLAVGVAMPLSEAALRCRCHCAGVLGWHVPRWRRTPSYSATQARCVHHAFLSGLIVSAQHQAGQIYAFCEMVSYGQASGSYSGGCVIVSVGNVLCCLPAMLNFAVRLRNCTCALFVKVSIIQLPFFR
jgi:hypothetical protein